MIGNTDTERQAGPPGQARPGQARPGQARPGQARPGQARPGQARPSRAEPSRAEPSRAKPSQATPNRTEPNRATLLNKFTSRYFSSSFVFDQSNLVLRDVGLPRSCRTALVEAASSGVVTGNEPRPICSL